jgi:ketosteroid isomerase-like protein
MSHTVEKQILRAEREQADAINRGDIPAAARMFDPSFVGFSSTRHERIRGLSALKNTFHHYFKQTPRMSYRIEKPQVHVSGGTAVATFYWSVNLGKGRIIRGRGTHVFAKKGRRWRVVHEHFSRAH